MDGKIFRETIFSINPYKISIIGDDPRTYFLKVYNTETDGSKREIVSEINCHIKNLRKLREAVEEAE